MATISGGEPSTSSREITFSTSQHPHGGLSPITPPEPPDNVNILSPLRILNNSAKPSPRDFIQTLVLMLACPTMETMLRGLIVEAQTGLLSNLISTFLFGLLMDRVSFGSTLVPLSGIYVVPLEENMVFTDIDFPVCLLFGAVCFLNISESELEAQALLVLQESSSQLMPFTAFGAVIEILWITLDDRTLVHKKEIWCLVVDEVISFSLLEFGEIIGLNTGPLPTERFEADQYKEFWEKLKVPLGMGPKLDELKEALAFWYSTMKPWGRTAYEVLIDSIKTLAPEGGSYTISGMTVALLIWACESVVCFSENFGRVVNNEDVPLLRWGGKCTRASFDNLLAAEINEHGEIRFNAEFLVRVRRMVLKDSTEEMFPKWPGEPDDPQLVSLIPDIHAGRSVKGFWEVQGNTQGNAQGKGNEKKKKMKGGVSSEADNSSIINIAKTQL
ncbi:hypothetical protein Bca4012_050979 [Brassica carinata]